MFSDNLKHWNLKIINLLTHVLLEITSGGIWSGGILEWGDFVQGVLSWGDIVRRILSGGIL